MADIAQTPLTPYQRLQVGLNPRVVIILTAAILLLPGAAAVLLVWFAVRPQQVMAARFIYLTLASLCLVVPFRLASIGIRRKWTTGSWAPSLDERLNLRGRQAGRAFPTSISPLMAIMYLSVAAVALAVALRDRFDPWNYGFVVIWLIFSVQSIWQLIRESRRSPFGK